MVKTFVILGPPKPKERPFGVPIVKKDGTAGVKMITRKQTQSYEATVKAEYHYQTGGAYFPDDTPLYVLIDCFISAPTSVSKKRLSEMLAHIRKPMRTPDWDNIGKIICDALNQVAYKDDKAIVDGRVRKFFSKRPRVVVTISDQPLDYKKFNVKQEEL